MQLSNICNTLSYNVKRVDNMPTLLPVNMLLCKNTTTFQKMQAFSSNTCLFLQIFKRTNGDCLHRICQNRTFRTGYL